MGLIDKLKKKKTDHMYLYTDKELDEYEKYIEENQFAKGSMLPKIEAAIRFAKSGEGRKTLITLLDKAAEGIAGKTGTVIHQ